MAENKNEIHIGDGVADAVKSTINTESVVILTELIKTVSDYLKSKLKDIPETIENLLNSPEAKTKPVSMVFGKMCMKRCVLSLTDMAGISSWVWKMTEHQLELTEKWLRI